MPARAATQSSLHAAFKRVQKHYRKAHPERDLPVLTVHELRHTHASLLFEAGQSVKAAQERLGHASAQVTLNTYAHLLHDAQSRAASALDDLLAGDRRFSATTGPHAWRIICVYRTGSLPSPRAARHPRDRRRLHMRS